VTRRRPYEETDAAPLVRHVSPAERGILDTLASGVTTSPGERARVRGELEGFLAELLAWNRDSNLVAANDLGRLASRHVLESLAVLPLLDRLAPGASAAVRLLDVGSGAGFPAVPLAIARPAWEVHAVESRRRKALFLQRIAERLEHANLVVHMERAERLELAPEQRADLATARAVAVLAELLPTLAALVRPGGYAVLFKGSSHATELAAWASAGDQRWRHVETVPVADRHLWFEVFARTGAG
jgi:16S rRNA (guanine527-N7)-methyltransferase